MADAVPTRATEDFRAARDFLLAHREHYDVAYRDFRWPDLDRFNYATDWLDVLAGEQGTETALWLIEEDGSERQISFGDMSLLSQRFAASLRSAGLGQGDRVLLLLGNVAPLWVAMLGCVRLGAVMIP